MFFTSMRAPISRSVSIRPVRRGLSRMAGSSISEPGTINAATIAKAAEDGSRGTSTAQPVSRAGPSMVMASPPSLQRATWICAPNAFSIFSL